MPITWTKEGLNIRIWKVIIIKKNMSEQIWLLLKKKYYTQRTKRSFKNVQPEYG